MGHFRFHRRIPILPGLWLNLSKRGISLSAGVPGATVNVSKDGVQGTAGIPGSGLSYRTSRVTPWLKKVRALGRKPKPEDTEQ